MRLTRGVEAPVRAEDVLGSREGVERRVLDQYVGLVQIYLGGRSEHALSPKKCEF